MLKKEKIKPPFPNCADLKNKPHSFCPGCGHQIILKELGFAIDEMKISKKVLLGLDIGCSLIAWNYFNLNSLQTHHGRTIPVVSGYKLARPDSIAIVYLGDGGAYAIGAQHLISSALRNDNITVIIVNNAVYGMTGGQEAPTTLPHQITSTTPHGADNYFLNGIEIVRAVNAKAFLARASVVDPLIVKMQIQKALNWQKENKGFSMVEILSFCPTNWKTNSAKETLEFINKMKESFNFETIQFLPS